jgi:MOSC domain-containing protein YiiM
VSVPSGTLVSVNTGRVEELVTPARTFRTAIVKRPRTGPVHAGRLGLEGDEQGDRRVHGGVDKAVYLYTAEHYDFWRGELGEPQLSPGTFGENLTVAGLDETRLHIGDELAIGGARFQVSEPRLPCATLAARMGRPDMQKRFVASERPGVYLRVLVEGPRSRSSTLILAAGAYDRCSAWPPAARTMPRPCARYSPLPSSAACAPTSCAGFRRSRTSPRTSPDWHDRPGSGHVSGRVRSAPLYPRRFQPFRTPRPVARATCLTFNSMCQ